MGIATQPLCITIFRAPLPAAHPANGEASSSNIHESNSHIPLADSLRKPVTAHIVLPAPLNRHDFQQSRGTPQPPHRIAVCRTPLQAAHRQTARQAVQALTKVACSIPLAIQSVNQLQLTLFYRHLATAVIFSSRENRLSRLAVYCAPLPTTHRQTSRQAAQTLSESSSQHSISGFSPQTSYSSHCFTDTLQPP